MFKNIIESNEYLRVQRSERWTLEYNILAGRELLLIR